MIVFPRAKVVIPRRDKPSPVCAAIVALFIGASRGTPDAKLGYCDVCCRGVLLLTRVVVGQREVKGEPRDVVEHRCDKCKEKPC